MADQVDVENALVGAITFALYPDGICEPTDLSPVACALCHVSRGWPDPQSLDAALKAGTVWVTVWPEPGMTRLTTRYPLQWSQITANTPTITATVNGQTVTIGGTIGANQVIGVQYGVGTLLSGYSYRALATDTAATIATALAAKIPSATASGAVVTLPSSAVHVAAFVVCDQLASIELRRQAQGFRISTFAPTPALRDAVAIAVDAYFAGLRDQFGNLTQFIQTNDAASSFARVLYRATYTDDKGSKDGMWRRDLCYTVEYATLLAEIQPELLFLLVNSKVNGSIINEFGVTD